MDIFYHAMNYTSKGIIDAFIRKSPKETNQLIKYLAKSNYRATSETSTSNRRMKGGVIELSKMTAIEGKLDAFMSRLGNQERKVHVANEVGTVERGEQKCIVDD